MNREAAIMGTPVYTIFAGQLPAVDRQLVAMDRLNIISDEDKICSLPLKKQIRKQILKNDNLCNEITQELLT